MSYRNSLLNSVILNYRHSRTIYEVNVFRTEFLDKIIWKVNIWNL